MHTIWAFLLQTLSVSLVAAVLLLIKWLMADKLSPRWQYGIWSLLALRIVLPVSMQRHVLLPLPLWIETSKAVVERTLDSAYTAVYTPISLKHVLPIFSNAPQSITDWLLVLYAAGVVVSVLWYALSFCRLRLLLRQAQPAPQQVEKQIQRVRAQYGLKGCPVMLLPGLQSAFICGGLRPILVFPEGREMDDKVILHELLHLKYHDTLQNMLWCLLRALHWCNPFIHYICKRIGNDLEALCDQRVLERLEGEERRAYGNILLSMANERYARAPGTSSISNGGKNIARRITAIVRFKKYPRGMALVSLCILVILACPTLMGTANAYAQQNFLPSQPEQLTQAMAMARINRCTTVAGALDTYTKGLLLENGIYIASASSLSQHKMLETQMRQNVENEGWVAYHLDSGRGLDYADVSEGYGIFNLIQNSDGTYQALLACGVNALLNEDGEVWLCDSEGNPYSDCCVIIPLRVRYEDAWIVEESGERILSTVSFSQVMYPGSPLPWLRQLRAEGETGYVTISSRTCYFVENAMPNTSWNFFGGTSFDQSAKVNASFDYARTWTFTTYTCHPDAQGRQPQLSIGLQLAELDSVEQEVTFPNTTLSGDVGGSSSSGFDWINQTIDADWDGSVESGSGSDCPVKGNQPVSLPAAYRVQTFWDGQVVEEFMLTEEQNKWKASN